MSDQAIVAPTLQKVRLGLTASREKIGDVVLRAKNGDVKLSLGTCTVIVWYDQESRKYGVRKPNAVRSAAISDKINVIVSHILDECGRG